MASCGRGEDVAREALRAVDADLDRVVDAAREAAAWGPEAVRRAARWLDDAVRRSRGAEGADEARAASVVARERGVRAPGCEEDEEVGGLDALLAATVSAPWLFPGEDCAPRGPCEVAEAMVESTRGPRRGPLPPFCPFEAARVAMRAAAWLLAARARCLDDAGRAQSPPPPVALDAFRVLKTVSRGSFGVLLLAEVRATGGVVALKALPKALARRSRRRMREAFIERSAMARAGSPFVARLYHAFESDDFFFLAMEYCPGGDLFSLLRGVGRLGETEVVRYAADVVLALRHVHSLGVVHHDLKPDNLLVAADGHLRLADFGLARVRRGVEAGRRRRRRRHSAPALSPPGPTGVPLRGTPDYLAPEAMLGLGASPAVDWWALGALLFEMLTGFPPFHADTEAAVLRNVLDGEIQWHLIPDDVEVSPNAMDLVLQLLEPSPSARPGAAAVMAHPFFAGIDWDGQASAEPVFQPAVEDRADVSYFDARAEVYPLPPAMLDAAALVRGGAAATQAVLGLAVAVADDAEGDNGRGKAARVAADDTAKRPAASPPREPPTGECPFSLRVVHNLAGDATFNNK